MSMSLDDAIFWIALTIFGAGIYLVPEYKAWGIALMVVGAAGIIYSIRAHLDAAKRPSWIMSLLMVLTWGLVGYDIYARARVPVSDHSSYYELDQRWGAYHYTEIWNQSFENTRVPLDGYKYRHCSFKDVTFTYEGKDPRLLKTL